MPHLWESEHEGCCASGNYHARSGECEEDYRTWAEFAEEYGGRPPGASLLFRWDWEKPDQGVMSVLELFYVGQSKAQRWSVTVAVHPDEEEAVRAYLQPRLDHLLGLWAPLAPSSGRGPDVSCAAAPGVPVLRVPCFDDESAHALAEYLRGQGIEGVGVDGACATVPTDRAAFAFSVGEIAVDHEWAADGAVARAVSDFLEGPDGLVTRAHAAEPGPQDVKAVP